MTVEEKIVFKLLNDSSITDLIADRLTPSIVNQVSDFPAIQYSIISSEPGFTFGSKIATEFYRIRFSCYAKNYSQTISLVNAVKNVLELWVDPVVGIQSSFSISENDLYNDSLKLYYRIIDFQIANNKDI